MNSAYVIYRHQILGDDHFSQFLRRLILSFGDAYFSVSLIDLANMDDHALRVVQDLVTCFCDTGLSDPDFQGIYSECYRVEMGYTLTMISLIVTEQDVFLSDLLNDS